MVILYPPGHFRIGSPEVINSMSEVNVKYLKVAILRKPFQIYKYISNIIKYRGKKFHEFSRFT